MGDVLVVNAGSTSLKLHLVSVDETGRAVDSLDQVSPHGLDAVAHRIVHGGSRFREPVVIDEAVRAEILALEPLAPLHNAPSLAGIEAARRVLPDIPHVAVFDTGFHATIPDEAAAYALPRRWREEWGVRRYGFHGLSVAWCAERVPAIVGRPVRRLVVCHLGGGSSVTAVLDGRSVDTTMGFSPLEGVPMTTRAGSVDPGALLFVLRQHGLDVDALDHALNAESGLKGLAGGSGDVRELEARAAEGDVDAGFALAVFAHRLTAAVAAMVAAAGGLDALAFTAGIGEHSALVRARVCDRLRFLGVELDATLNGEAGPDREIGSAHSAVAVVIVRAREELVAARAARRVMLRPRAECPRPVPGA